MLESVEGPEKLAEYSFIGFDPVATIQVKNGKFLVENKVEEQQTRGRTSNPLNVVKKLVANYRCPFADVRFIGGAVGYVSYDAIRYWEKLPSKTTDDLAFPDIEMGIYLDGIAFDHKRNQAFYYTLGRDRFNEIKGLTSSGSTLEPLTYSEPKVNTPRDRFEASVAKAKEYIAAGDIFQVVLSKRYGMNVRGGILGFYEALRKINPSPYMYFVKMDNRYVVGSSPEMLVRIEEGTVETYPIAGTRPRGADAQQDLTLEGELASDPKERAEHVMLVDLARNDVGRVCQHGSVHVPEFMTVHKFSHVQHIVSRVVGKLKADRDAYDCLEALFPAGTVSGAPKVRAMEIIEESELARRGPYAGAVGYFSFNGNGDFAITIRTLVVQGNSAYVQAGAGIVADSVPEREWYETEHKAQALMKAMEAAGEMRP